MTSSIADDFCSLEAALHHWAAHVSRQRHLPQINTLSQKSTSLRGLAEDVEMQVVSSLFCSTNC